MLGRGPAHVVLLISLAGCVVESVCYNDADCPDTHLCHRPISPPALHGECRKRCETDEECHHPDRVCELREGVVARACLDRCDCPPRQTCDPNGHCLAGDAPAGADP